MFYIHKPDRSLVKVEKWSDYDLEKDGRLLVPYSYERMPYGHVDPARPSHIFFYNTKTGKDKIGKGFSFYRGDCRAKYDFIAVALFYDWDPDKYPQVPRYRWALMDYTGKLVTSLIYREIFPPLHHVQDEHITVAHKEMEALNPSHRFFMGISRPVYVFLNYQGHYGVFDMLDEPGTKPVVSFTNDAYRIDGFKYGLSRVAVLDKSAKEHISWDIPPLLYGLLDSSGNWRVTPRFKYMESFYNKEDPFDLIVPVAIAPPDGDDWVLKQYLLLHDFNFNIPYPDLDKVLKKELEDIRKAKMERDFNDSYSIWDALDYESEAIWNLPDY